MVKKQIPIPISVATTAIQQLVTGYAQQNLLIEKFLKKEKKQRKAKTKITKSIILFISILFNQIYIDNPIHPR